MKLCMEHQRNYVVLYKTPDILPFDPPLAFKCLAENTEHAEEQCVNAEPQAEILWTVVTNSIEDAYNDYWNNY